MFNNEGKIDSASPYYLRSGDQPGNLITHVLLQNNNYHGWSRTITTALKARRKFVFINGTIQKPVENGKLLNWETVNSMWDYLEKRFSVANRPRLQQLCAEITCCKQTKEMSLEQYYNKLTGLFDEVSRLKPLHRCSCRHCTCNLAGRFRKTVRRRNSINIWWGLMMICMAWFALIVVLLSIPSLDDAYSTFTQDGQSKVVVKAHVETESVHAFAVQPVPSLHRLERIDRSKLQCSHCRQKGHDVATCFKLYGYPEWWEKKHKRGKGTGLRTPIQPVIGCGQPAGP
ncbi:hypothetical protein LIER_10600 [Lithospermum erythrorhizon]|uniref:Retrotransposon Copia-like N-terminal domain-containing protein n=1 Tax=Lithospermum erythrorhizon TaxID=34254 RepID=A0AAV3PJX4_LITER